jgi:hypothetical protein
MEVKAYIFLSLGILSFQIERPAKIALETALQAFLEEDNVWRKYQ